MDEAGFPPDGHCFSMLLEVMLISRELDALDDMLEHVAVSDRRGCRTSSLCYIEDAFIASCIRPTFLHSK
jgi:hypothetical protein